MRFFSEWLRFSISLAPVIYVLGVVVFVFSFSILLPMAYAYVAQDPAKHAFDEAFFGSFFIGTLLILLTRKTRRELKPKDGFLLVVLVWTVLPAVATIPLLSHLSDLSFTDAYFETMSGFTTTGATVLFDLDHLPASLNLWRGLLVWLGGMGILVLAVAILPLLGVGGSQLFKAETPGPMKDTKLTPRITETAKGLYLVYVLLSIMCCSSYRLAGMDWVDAFVHTGSTMGLGGFSSHDASFAYYNSFAIEAVAMVFMVIASINFGNHFLALRQKSIKPYLVCTETKFVVLSMIVAIVIIACVLVYRGVYSSFDEALRFAAFNTISMATTTGFANADFGQWPMFCGFLLLLMCSFCSAAGSTGGGIKMARAILLVKQAVRELVRTLHPRAINPVRMGTQTVENRILFGVLAYMLLYGVSITIITMALMLTDLDPISAFSATVACLNNTGPGLGEVGPATNYASLTSLQTWICSIAMLLGRLELIPVLMMLLPSFWRS